MSKQNNNYKRRFVILLRVKYIYFLNLIHKEINIFMLKHLHEIQRMPIDKTLSTNVHPE